MDKRSDKRMDAKSEKKGLVCPYQKKCGGCTYINKDYTEQLRIKQKLVSELLGDIAKQQRVNIDPIVPAENPLYYRNKVHSVFTLDRSGKPVRGLYSEGSHEIVSVSGCKIEDKDADAVIEEIYRLLRSFKIRVYDEDMMSGLLRHVLVRVGMVAGAKQMMVVLVTSGPIFPSKNNFVKALRDKFPCITTVIQNINPKKTNMVLGERNVTIYGKGYIEDELCGLKFRISPSSFYQINHEQTEKLYKLAVEKAGLTGAENVLDAYCGTGTIGMMMAAGADKVIGVELNRDAVHDAVFNMKQNSINNMVFVSADATEYIKRLAAEKCRIDVLCMDPPRAGSTEEFIAAAAELKCKRVVYVSCNPETLARDLKSFVGKGYSLKSITPVDMFPNTGHVETVVLLSQLRQKPDDYIHVDVDVAELEGTSAETKATYEKIKKYVAEHNDGMKVSSLNIAQVKAKHGIIERENYNKAKSEDVKQPQCPKEKEDAIVEALQAFQMI